MKIHYLEFVSSDVNAICNAYAAAHDVQFSEPDAMLGGARTCKLPDGSMLGVRAPMRETEDPIIRPYWLVDDIDKAVSEVKLQGAEIALPPMEIPGKGKFAIYILGGINHGLWQL
ncbi:MAG: hydroxylase [Gammaproteobacteria bacterium]|nr:hydroxylase [Gammaproteobacteria bacterium]